MHRAASGSHRVSNIGPCGSIIHAERREHELKNVVDFLQSEMLPYTMAEATRTKLQWLADHHVKDNFESGVARDWKKVLEGWKL